MGPFDLLNHLLNFVAPAICVALGVTFMTPRVLKTRAPDWRRQLLVNAGVGVLVLVAGLVLLGRDGKMVSYAALVVAIATSQWVMQRGRRA